MSPIANMITMILNAQAVRKDTVMVPFSKMKQSIAQVMLDKGFLSNIEKKKKKVVKTEQDFLQIKLRYDNTVGIIRGVKLLSKPSRRIYAHKNDLHKIMNGQGISVVSTSKGVMTGEDAKKAGMGGEVIFEIW